MNETLSAEEVIRKHIGEQVSVFVGASEDRRGFEMAISVSGILEIHPDYQNNYRVLINKGTYSYFDTEDVDSITYKDTGFKDGSKLVIRLSINSVSMRVTSGE